jgi:hypothetical protein
MKDQIVLKMTEDEFTTLISAIDTLSAMSVDEATREEIKAIDKVFNKNGYKRKYK